MDITSESFDDCDINDLIDKVKQHKFFNVTNICRKSYCLICDIKIPDNVELIGYFELDFNLYVWYEKEHGILLLGYPNSPLKSWYKIKKETELKLAIDFFKNKNKNYCNIHRMYLNTQHDYLTILNYFKNSHFTNNILFSNEKEEKNNNNRLTELDDANIFSTQIKSNTDLLHIYTKYSNSKIKIENHNGFIILELNYNHIKLRNRYDPFDKFMPSDISVILCNFDLKSMNDILTRNELSEVDIDICVLLAQNTNLNKLKTKLEETKKHNPIISKYIDNVIKHIKCDELFLRIENDGIFRSFENSVDILLKTVYERFKDTKYDDYTYINELLKYKVNDIFYTRLI